MSVVYLSTAYLAPVSYYKAMCRYDTVVVEAYSHYVKQSYRNRCTIASADGLLPLSIPVERTREGKPFTRDMRISRHDNWQHIHWNAIASAYGSAPFFDYFCDDLRPFTSVPVPESFCSITTRLCKKPCAVCWESLRT